MKKLLKASSVLLGLGLYFTANAQSSQTPYYEQMGDHTVNFYTVQQSFEDYWQDKEPERSHGYKQFKRWESFWEPRVYPSGERPNPGVLYTEQQTAFNASAKTGLGNWSHIGPFDGNALDGIGRVNCLAFHPDNSNIIYAGAPAGGLWKSTDGGVTWSTNTDLLPNLGVSSIAIDPHNPDTMYIATGDRDAADTYSIGVLKTTDGGQTWNTTGLTYSVTQSRRASAIYINPKNTQEIVVATRLGIQRSTNGGASFSQVHSGSWQMMTFVPTATDTLFAGGNNGGRIARSVDAGATWTNLTGTSNLPTSGGSRVELATTADDPNYVYAVISANNNGLEGVYRSTNGGTTWTQTLSGSSQNLLHWGTNPGGNSGSSAGGQGWYDLAIAVSPINKDFVYVGGVNIWRSTNGGTSWSLSAHWYGGGGAAFAHADQHFFLFKPGTAEFYAGNDGGVYKTTNGTNYTELCNGLHITQYYKIDITEADENLTIGGAQDNGTHLEDNAIWDRVKGGDGMDNAIAENNPNVMYAASQYGNFSKSTNRGQSFNASFNLPPNGNGQWVTPFVIDPNDDNTLYVGYDQLWKSTNAGLSFTSVGPNFNTPIDVIAVAPSNSNIVYLSINEDLYRSTNGGTTFTLISNNLNNSNSITDIAVSSSNADQVYVTKSGYSNSAKVYVSMNAGGSWSNISGSLPNLPANAIAYQEGSNDALYVGTDIGVYYRDAGSSDWTSFMNGLPNVIVNDLEIHNTTGVIRAGTYGRGMWQSPLASSFLNKPEAQFNVEPGATCSTNDTVTLEDISLYVPTQWNWTLSPSTYTFVNGTGASSENPQVVFSAPGTYTVQLIASNRFGRDTAVEVGAIGVGGYALPFTEDFSTGIPETWDITNPDNGITWAPNGAGNGSAYMDFYAYSSVGAKDGLITPAINLTGASNTKLYYDVAYRQYSSSTHDSLNIYISTDCGATWTLLAARGEDGTQNLATGAPMTGVFTPASASDWRTDSLDLSAYDGNTAVRIRFEGVTNYGNNLYLDNINVNASPSGVPTADFFANNASCEGRSVQFYNTTGFGGQSVVWHFPGGTPSISTANNPVVTYSSAGNFDVSLVATNANGSDSIHRASYISITTSVTPSVTLTSNATTICEGEDITFYAAEINGGTSPEYDWFVNGTQRTLTGDTVLITGLTNNDTVRVSLRSSEACASLPSVGSNGIVITVNPLPTVDAGTYNTVCTSTPVFALNGTPAGGTFTGNGVSGGQFDPSATGPGTHTVTYTYADPSTGCTNTDEVDIVVNIPPTTFLSGKTYCESDPAESPVGGFPLGGTYRINGNVVTTVDPSALGPGKYTFEYTYNNGICDNTVLDSIIVVAAPTNPTVTVTWGSLTCNISGYGYSYQWLDGSGAPIPGETNRVFYPSTPGNYAVRVRAGSTCSETSNTVYIQNVSVEDLMAERIQLELYPNPTSDVFALRFELFESTEVNVELLDLAGRVLEQRSLGTQNNRVEVPFSLKPFAKGVYMVRLTLGDVTITRRVIRE